MKGYRGWIYCITNQINGKKYIGQTINYNRRKREHFVFDETCTILGRAFAKYGKENFKMEALLTFTAVNQKVRKQLLNYFERWYIIKYSTYKTGYNATLGGEGSLGFKHSKETIEKLKEIRRKERETREYKGRPVLLYNLNGEFVCEYKTVSDAVRAVGRNANCSFDIRVALDNPNKKVHGYLWRYKVSDDYPLIIDPYVWPTSKAVYHYSKDGILLKAYKCALDAAKELNISVKRIYGSVNKPYNTHRTDYWTHNPPAA